MLLVPFSCSSSYFQINCPLEYFSVCYVLLCVVHHAAILHKTTNYLLPNCEHWESNGKKGEPKNSSVHPFNYRQKRILTDYFIINFCGQHINYTVDESENCDSTESTERKERNIGKVEYQKKLGYHFESERDVYYCHS